MEIKIVGTVTDESSLEEIENIAQIFAYEQRMKCYTSLLPKHFQTKNVQRIPGKKINKNNRFIPNSQAHILVKGLY